MYDLLIENARICDGMGTPSFHGCVAVKDGLIAAIGKHGGEAAAKTINADGLVLAPGFIDPHTHYDAQVAWDPLITCSSRRTRDQRVPGDLRVVMGMGVNKSRGKH